MPELGILGNQAIVSLSSAGNLTWLGLRSRELRWGVGADDQWHFSEQRTSIRQSTDSNDITPITRMKVPGGDITQRVDVVPWNGRSITKLEFNNETPVPVAISILLIDFGSMEVVETMVKSEGEPVIRLSKPIGSLVAASGYENLTNEIQHSQFSGYGDDEETQSKSGVDAALIFPLPHATKLEILISNEDLSSFPTLNEIPSFNEISNGWKKHFDNGMEIQTDNEKLMTTVNAAKKHLLLGSDQNMSSEFWNSESTKSSIHLAVLALMSWGHANSAKKLLYKYMENVPDSLFMNKVNRHVLYALCLWEEYIELCSEEESLEEITPWLEESISMLLSSLPNRRRLKNRDISLELASLKAAVSLLIFIGNDSLASDIQGEFNEILKRSGTNRVSSPFSELMNSFSAASEALRAHLNSNNELKTFDHILSEADTTGSFPKDSRSQDPIASALFLLAIRACFLIKNVSPDGQRVIDIAPLFSPDWIGKSIEVKNAPIQGGNMGYAIRWHGTSPALLWEAKTVDSLTISADSIDKDWESADLIGEALLAKQTPPETAVTIQREQATFSKSIDPESPDGGTFQ